VLREILRADGLLVAVAPEAAASLPGPIVGDIVAGEPGAIAVR
jgi:hypothetical protein